MKATAGDDPVAQLRTLDAMRTSGLLTPAAPPATPTAPQPAAPAPLPAPTTTTAAPTTPAAPPDPAKVADAALLAEWQGLRERGQLIRASAFYLQHHAAIERAQSQPR